MYLQEEKRVGTSTLEQTRKFGRNYILPVCGNLKISRLNEGHLQRVLNLSAQKGCLQPHPTRPPKGPLSLKTLRGLRNTEQQFVKWCRINDFTDLVLEGLEVRTCAEKQEKEILQPEELQTLFRVDTRLVRGERVFDDQIYAYRSAVVTGLRPGELMGLHIGDIDGDKLHISGPSIAMEKRQRAKIRMRAAPLVSIHSPESSSISNCPCSIPSACPQRLTALYFPL